MAETADRLLPNAGGLLIAAGAVAAFVGGSHGLAAQRPGLILASVILLMGYGIVGYLLMTHGARYFSQVLPASAVLIVATLVLFRGDFLFADEGFSRFVLQPGLTLLLVYAGASLLTHAIEHASERATWPASGTSAISILLHLAAYAPVWCAFSLLEMLGRGATPGMTVLVVGGSVIASVACVVGAQAATRGNHPGITVIGAALGFVASGAYLFQFMLQTGGSSSVAFFGQFNALAGLILTALPVAMGTVAWIQTTPETPEEIAREEPPTDPAR